MGSSFVLFDVSIVISHGQFHCGNRGHTQKSHFPLGKRSSGTATIVLKKCKTLLTSFLDLLASTVGM